MSSTGMRCLMRASRYSEMFADPMPGCPPFVEEQLKTST